MPPSEFCEKVKKNVAANFDQSHERYQAFEDKHCLFADLAAALAQWVGICPGSAVLDVGCGNGISSRVLNERYGCRVLGVDLSPGMVSAGRRDLEGIDGIRLVEGDGENLTEVVGEERFDAVLYNASIFIFPDVGRAIRQAAACLGRGGTIAFSFYPLLQGPDGEDLLDEAFGRMGQAPPRFRVITDYSVACQALERHCGAVTHHQWVRPLDFGLVKDFFAIPAQSAALFPALDYTQRQAHVHRLFDTISDLAPSGSIIWRMAKAKPAAAR